MKLLTVCGARPNVVKIAALARACAMHRTIENVIVHTGQHYDELLSERIFRDLELPAPDICLHLGSASHAVQTAEIMRAFEPIVIDQAPDWVVVVGDVNSTLACALVAAKVGARVAHVEAGLRSFDRTMPEEINRDLTDRLSDLLFVSEPAGVDNLHHEGIDDSRIHFVGSVAIDTMLHHRERARQSCVLADLGVGAGEYVVATIHRQSNVDDPAVLRSIVEALRELARDCPVVLPAHPRTRRRLEEGGLMGQADGPGLRVIQPLGYLDFLELLANARASVTDSGGVQEETTMLGVPCLTVRRSTERPITVAQGTNRLVAPERRAILAAWNDEISRPRRPGVLEPPPLWDGHAAERVVKVLAAQTDE
jgi:UDP-N-acetylglucosamine 2-epimerase (non-hydrolysing)